MLRLIWLLVVLALCGEAQAANTTLGNLSAGGAISGTDLFYDVQTVGSGGVRVTGTQMQTFVWGVGGATTASSTATFNNSALIMKGTSTGTTIFTTANAGATTFTATFPANTGTLAETNLAQTFSAAQTFSSTLVFSGVGAGTQTKCLGLDVSNNVVTNAAACGSGGGGTPGGANTNVQFNNSGSFGGDAGFTYAGNGQVTHALGSIAANAKSLNITGTFNNAAVTFDAPLFMNITDTASATGSFWIDIQRGGSTYFAIGKDSNGKAYLQLNPTGFILTYNNGDFIFSNANVPNPGGTFMVQSAVGVQTAANYYIGFTNTSGNSNATVDAAFSRDATGVIDVGTGAVGSVAGTVKAANYISASTVPIDGGGTCTATAFAGGASAGTFTAPACAAGTIAITFAFTAPTGWSCDAEDRTTIATGKLQQTASTSTKATFTATTTASDVVQYKCIAY